MKIVTLVPARKGSKRLPGKNIKPFCGKPLVAYAIEAGLNSAQISDCVVSTDDPEVMRIAGEHEATLIKRPDAISGDLSSTSEVVQHMIESLGLSEEDWVVTLQATNPLRPKNLLDEAIEFAKNAEGHWDCLVGVSSLKEKFGIVQKGYYFPSNYVAGQRSQDMKTQYFFENGLVYITKVATVIQHGNMFGESRLGYICEGDFAYIDIDDIFDFEFGESVYQRIKEKYQLI